jgi:nucleoside triphosphate pyrophosphatase
LRRRRPAGDFYSHAQEQHRRQDVSATKKQQRPFIRRSTDRQIRAVRAVARFSAAGVLTGSGRIPSSEDAGYTTVKIILASSSPRRADILRDAGIAFQIYAAEINETPRPGEQAHAMVARLAEAKARTVAAQLDASPTDCIIVGADTTVELDGQILGKPRDAQHAREMLASLSGRTHQVLTGIFLLRLPGNGTRAAVEKSAVTIAPLIAQEIDLYVASGEPFGKAGAYAIQGLAGRYIPKIEGCYFNVVGLPLARLYALLGELGWRSEE